MENRELLEEMSDGCSGGDENTSDVEMLESKGQKRKRIPKTTIDPQQQDPNITVGTLSDTPDTFELELKMSKKLKKTHSSEEPMESEPSTSGLVNEVTPVQQTSLTEEPMETEPSTSGYILQEAQGHKDLLPKKRTVSLNLGSTSSDSFFSQPQGPKDLSPYLDCEPTTSRQQPKGPLEWHKELLPKKTGIIRHLSEPSTSRAPTFPRIQRNPNALTLFDPITPTRGEIFVITYVYSPSEFYIAVCDENSIMLPELRHNIALTYAQTDSPYESKLEAEYDLGSFCVAFNRRLMYWFRARVLDWLHARNENELSSEFVSVQDVDTGRRQILSFRSLRPLLPMLVQIPCLVLKCRLAYLYPPKSTIENRLTDWPSKSIRAMYSLSGIVEGEEILHCDNLGLSFIEHSNNSDALELDYVNVNVLEQTGVEDSIVSSMVNNGFAIQIKDVSTELNEHDYNDDED